MNVSVIAAVLLAVAVGLGAFGAHGLKDKLDAYSMALWEKAVFYQFIHALGMLVVPLFAKSGALSNAAANRIAMVLCAGIVLFCGSLYLLALTGVRTWGAVTPFGGICFIAGWLMLAWSLARRP
jgi:uncharacterized membrane protein YgdD (TMEM256/DUF423 family)